MPEIKNIPASIRQRLLNKAKEENRPFHELLQYYAMERFLYRLSSSPHVSHFILKGALMLHIWQAPNRRSTMDIDLLGKCSNRTEIIIQQIKEIISIEVADGVIFEQNILTEFIAEETDYSGVRVQFLAFLDTAKIPMQIDIGFGDCIFPMPEQHYLPTLLNLPAPFLWCYSRESVIAEKLEAMMTLGALNSRMKDFYDVWFLSRQYSFNGETLARAIQLTFKQRKTEYTEPIFLSANFVQQKQSQWMAFRKRLGNEDYIQEKFEGVVESLKLFLEPILLALKNEIEFKAQWKLSRQWE